MINNYALKKVVIVSRPKPNVLLKHVDSKTYKSEEVLESDAIYAVFYKGKPINLRAAHSLINYPSPKYKKVSFSNKGHAFNLAEKLNEKFNCNDFSVYKLTNGTQISEE